MSIEAGRHLAELGRARPCSTRGADRARAPRRRPLLRRPRRCRSRPGACRAAGSMRGCWTERSAARRSGRGGRPVRALESDGDGVRLETARRRSSRAWRCSPRQARAARLAAGRRRLGPYRPQAASSPGQGAAAGACAPCRARPVRGRLCRPAAGRGRRGQSLPGREPQRYAALGGTGVGWSRRCPHLAAPARRSPRLLAQPLAIAGMPYGYLHDGRRRGRGLSPRRPGRGDPVLHRRRHGHGAALGATRRRRHPRRRARPRVPAGVDGGLSRTRAAGEPPCRTGSTASGAAVAGRDRTSRPLAARADRRGHRLG